MQQEAQDDLPGSCRSHEAGCSKNKKPDAMNAPKTKQHEIRRLHPVMTVVDARVCRQMEDALRSVMNTPIPHAVGCSHDDKTCTCHRAKALAALSMPNDEEMP